MGKVGKVGSLHKTSVARVLKDGARGSVTKTAARGGVRVSKEASKESTKATERMLKELGEACEKTLKMMKTKTVTKDLLISVIEGPMACQGLSSKAVKGASAPGTRKGSKDRPVHAPRQDIAIASCLKGFGKGIVLGKGAYRISGDAKYAIAAVTHDYVVDLGKRAGRYTNAGRRATVSSSDVASAVNIE